MNDRLPVFNTIMKALTLPYIHFRTLVYKPLILYILMLVAWYVSDTNSSNLYNMPQFSNEDFFNSSWLLPWIVIILYWIVALFTINTAVECHRAILLDEHEVSDSRIFNWSGVEFNYAAQWIVISLTVGLYSSVFILPVAIVSLVIILIKSDIVNSLPVYDTLPSEAEWLEQLSTMMPIFHVPIGLLFLVGLVPSYLFSRYSLALPAAAIGLKHKGIRWSWSASSGNGWRLTLLVFFLPFTLGIMLAFLPSVDSFVVNVVYNLLYLAVGVFEIGVLSLAFKFLVGNESPVEE